GAQRQHLSGARAAERRDDARRRRPRQLERVERPQRVLDEAGRLHLLEGELGMRVQVAPPGDRLLLDLDRDEIRHSQILPRAPITCRSMAEPRDTTEVTMDKIVSLCRRRGFVFPSSEIYGGLGSTYDYGHYGVLAKNNIRERWFRAMVQ